MKRTGRNRSRYSTLSQNLKRDMLYPEYKPWRLAVFRRDHYVCRMPKCGSKIKLQAHHIRRWADAPTLRFDVNNGITLCKKCHELVTKNEDFYITLFQSILFPQNNEKLYRIMRGLDE